MGKIQPGWLEIERFQGVEDAPAYVLEDFGSVEFETQSSSHKVKYTYRRVVKIQSEAGLAYKRVSFVYRTKEFRELLLAAEGATYDLNPEGEVVQFAVERRNMQEERLEEGYRRIWFDLPFVKVGSVIEYRFVLSSGEIETLRPWFFQDTIPIRQSEYHAWIPSAYEYLISAKGNIQHLREDLDRYHPEGNPFSRRRAEGSRSGSYYENAFANYYTGTHFLYQMDDIAALKAEAFSPETNDYIPSLYFQLFRDRITNRRNPNVFTDWTSLNKQMQRKLKVKKARLNREIVKNIVQRAGNRRETDLAKAQYIYEYVRGKFTWNNEYTIDVGNINSVLEKQTGSSGEINILLLHLLREAGLSVDPVLISTRENGKVSSVIPTIEQFNHIILRLQVNRQTFLLDALHDRPEFGVLPKNDLNQKGYQLSPGEGEWIALSNPGNTLNRTTYTRFNLSPEGELTGEISVINKGYRAALERERLQDFDDPSNGYFQQYVLLGLGEYQMSDPTIQDQDKTDTPLVLECALVTKAFTEVAGELMFIRPVMAWPILENPFPQMERMTPVDLTFPLQEAYMLGLILPEGYEIEQLPQPVKVVMPNNGGTFTFNVFLDGNILHLTSVLQLNQTLFLPEEYESVQAFFNYITTKHEEDIILKRIQ